MVQVLKEAVGNEDKKLALLAFEALESLGVSEGVVKPTVKEAPSRLINPVDNSEMAFIPAGTFLYGSRENDPVASSDEKPQRVIDLHAFYMDVYPVTNEQYRNFLQTMKPDKDTLRKWMNLEGSYEQERCRIKKDRKDYTVENGYERCPVIYVRWLGADAYAKWAGKRLPTEQEWEKAARGPDGRVYPWGDTFDAALCNSAESGIGETIEVDKFLKGKSYYGCYDMAGNVWEWTDSWYEKEKYRVLRGGSWLDGGNYCRCALRLSLVVPDVRNDGGIGFRCARTLTL
ncbi:MAG: formylglycine-generating enzyme family protein [Candidatus Brocadia sp.]|nr:MAG: formylglycine-generating enzyme family protein [Candidatus Brocadia sp.]